MTRDEVLKSLMPNVFPTPSEAQLARDPVLKRLLDAFMLVQNEIEPERLKEILKGVLDASEN